MFSSKIISTTCQVLGVLLILKALLVVTMFVWSFYGVPPVPMINAHAPGLTPYLVLTQEIATSALLYVFVGFIGSMVSCHNKMAPVPVKKAVRKRKSR